MDKKPEHSNSPSTEKEPLETPQTEEVSKDESVDSSAAVPTAPTKSNQAEADDASQSDVDLETKPVKEASQPAESPSKDIPTPPSASEQIHAEPAPAKPKGQGPALLVALLALVIGAGAGGFSYWQWQQRQQHQLQSNELAASVTALETAQRDLRLSLEAQLLDVQRQNQAAAQRIETLGASLSKVEATLEKARNLRPQDWLIAEADYLVQMAGRKLWLEQDQQTAIALLKDADRSLSLVKDGAQLPIRAALAKDIATLEGLPRQDLAGVALKIESMIAAVETLPLNRVELPDAAETEVVDTPSESVDDWKANLARNWKAMMDDFITVRRRQGELQPLLAPEQEWYLREHLRGKLMQAQLALYHGHTDAYQKALGTASGWIDTYFKRDDAAVDSALSNLEALRKVEFVSKLPIELASQPLLERLVAERLGTVRESR
ncbi:uroporphyrinogen-III C-methyltransferase [Ferrimonas aestuarii]|uniref:Uroporphyrin-3 C-methyltransferase n=1 Tax=Ferrimonas aestuarii TaxID=2569539 RepID=A0A4U1BQ94_9GAMM|nr:uroporphyrinogen-III C-methyltransferase [Ferrimonas aestuarii]TKB56157.1 hypothetical protein FCL42_08050 [Ferrimonas aestuarii]